MLDILMYSEDAVLSQQISTYLLERNKHFRILHIMSEETDLIKMLKTSHFDFLLLITEKMENTRIAKMAKKKHLTTVKFLELVIRMETLRQSKLKTVPSI